MASQALVETEARVKILWKSAHPELPTGYGQQTALLLPRLKALGHELAISCTTGQTGHHTFWGGMPVFGASGYNELGEDTVGGDYEAFGADLVITFFCTWRLQYPPLWRNLRTLHLMNVDCDPMSWGDYVILTDTGGMPAATSRRGWEIMRKGGKGTNPHDLREPLDPLYLPHGTDLKLFSPHTAKARGQLRADAGIGKDTFVVGMNFMNADRFPDRKNLQRQLRGFAAFHAKHPDSLLLIHAIERLPDGYHLPALLSQLGLDGAYRLSPQWELVTGLITPATLANWYRMQDVYLGAGNEGFGLPGLEAQACGTPAILLDAQSGPELAGDCNWLVTGEPDYNEVHRADWLRASAQDVTRCLEEAHVDARHRREQVREHATAWDINKIVTDHWAPALAELE